MTPVDFTNIKVSEVLSKAESTRVKFMDAYAERIMDRASNPRELSGLATPWERLEDKFRIREGELSILGAYNGAGKTTFSCQLAVHLAKSVKVGIASLEMEIDDLGVMMAQQANHADNPTKQAYENFIAWSSNRIAVYDRMDVIKPEDALACLYHMIVDLGCKFLVLDSLMMVGVVEDNEDCRRFVQTLSALAKKFHVHIMLIHHMKKPDTKDQYPPMPGKYHLLGSSHLSNMAATVLIWWKDEKAQADKTHGTPNNDPDYRLRIAKQRFGKFEGTLGFFEGKGRTFNSTRRGDSRHIQLVK